MGNGQQSVAIRISQETMHLLHADSQDLIVQQNSEWKGEDVAICYADYCYKLMVNKKKFTEIK